MRDICRISIDHYGCLVIFNDVYTSATYHLLEKRRRESVAIAVAISHGTSVATISISQFRGISTILHDYFAIYFA